VCVRLATYEDKEEGQFLQSFGVTRSGELENTVFTILSPDGKRQLARASRSARQTFGNAQRMAQTMNRIAEQMQIARRGSASLALPKVVNVRLALDMAACDNRLLVVLFSPDAVKGKDLQERVNSLAWTEPFLGQFLYVAASEARELAPIEKAKPVAGILVVQPDSFGQKGVVVKQIDASCSVEELEQGLKDSLAPYRPAAKSFADHVRAGHRQGVFWETVLPVTDPMERQARERGRRGAAGRP
jgi:hypothetical protein